jgi:hypothetical protein
MPATLDSADALIAPIYTSFHIKLPFLELYYTASAKCRYQSHHSMDSQAPKKEPLMKSSI